MELNIKNIDVTKADLGLRHEFVIPDTDMDEKEWVVIDCEYLAPGERMKFSNISTEETVSIDLPKVFLKKVKGIRNLVINGKSVTTSEEFLRYPAVAELDRILTKTVAHILDADNLTEDEVKN